LNDDPDETKKLCDWVLTHLGPDVPLHFTAFHPDFKLQDKPRTPAATLHRARQVALDAGLHFVYEGNIYSEGANTYCPQCRELLVRRSWHDVLENRLRDGSCSACGFAIAGVWNKDKSAKSAASGSIAAASRNYGHLNL
jgi:pyruvate formate lyase activating enzyme